MAMTEIEDVLHMYLSNLINFDLTEENQNSCTYPDFMYVCTVPEEWRQSKNGRLLRFLWDLEDFQQIWINHVGDYTQSPLIKNGDKWPTLGVF